MGLAEYHNWLTQALPSESALVSRKQNPDLAKKCSDLEAEVGRLRAENNQLKDALFAKAPNPPVEDILQQQGRSIKMSVQRREWFQ